MMRKMHVPAYPAVVDGVQPLEYRGVCWLLKKAIVIDEASIVMDDDISIVGGSDWSID
jgi:hypothetical protein